MIKFKQKDNKLDDLINLLYKIINESYTEHIREKEKKQIQDSLKMRLQNMNPYMSQVVKDLRNYGDLMDKIL